MARRIKPGSKRDRMMEKRYGMKPGSAADRRMERTGKPPAKRKTTTRKKRRA